MTDPAQPDEYAKLKAQKEAILLRQSPNKKLLSRLVELKELVENYHGVFPNRAVIAEALRDAAAALVSPPVQPVEATPLVDSAEWENSLQCSTFVVTSEFARHLERTLSLAIRQLSLAQTENAGHIRIEDELKAECFKLSAGSCIHELVGDPYGHFECSKVIELQNLLKTSQRLHLEASENAHMHYTNSADWKRKAEEAKAGVAELEKQSDARAEALIRVAEHARQLEDTLAQAQARVETLLAAAKYGQDQAAQAQARCAELEASGADMLKWLDSDEVKACFQQIGSLSISHPHLAVRVTPQFHSWAMQVIQRFRSALSAKPSSR